MNNHCGWFDKEYPDAHVLRIMIIPTNCVAYDADFTHDVKILRKNSLNQLKKNVINFFKELKEYDLNCLEERFIHNCLKMHDLDNESIIDKYVENPKIQKHQ